MEATAQANLLGYLALFSYPLVAIVLFSLYPPRWAAAIVTIGGHLFLPTNFTVHFSGLPPMDKNLIVSISAFFGCLIVRPKIIRRGNKKGRRYSLFILLAIVGLYFTVLNNPDSIKVGQHFLPGLTSHDFFSMAIRELLTWWPALVLGRKIYTKVDDLEALCVVWTVGGLVYSLFIFVELKISPQFNRWIYGYQASGFDQAIRGGGYRPVVFMGHGLAVAMFILISVLAATGLAKARKPLFGIPGRWIAFYMAGLLAIIHSAGALVYGIVFVPVLIWMSPRWQARLAMGITALVFCYPILRFYDLVPVDSIQGFFSAVLGTERAGSLGFRFTNENELLVKAIQRPWFGWGGWARQFTYSDWGAQTALADGEWIAVLGYAGMVGFIGAFGLLLSPIFAFARNSLRQITQPRERALASAVLFVTVACVVDLIPNSGVPPHTLMAIGALAGIQVQGRSENHPSVDG